MLEYRPVLANLTSTSASYDSDAWGATRQSTVEERVIDRYVIDTHQPSEPTDEPKAFVEEPEVLISPSWDGQAAPAPVQDQYEEQEEDEEEAAVEEEEDYEANYVSADAAAQLELEFSAALVEEHDEDLVDPTAFSAELLSRSLQQPNSGQLPF